MLKRVAQLLAIMCAAAFVDGCDSRAPESALFGTWRMTFPHGIDSIDWIALYPDHSFVWFTFSGAGEKIDSRGSWNAGGNYVYMRGEGKTVIWEIVEILPDELRLRHAKQDYTFKRDSKVPPQASNQAMQLTASKLAIYARSVCRRERMLRGIHKGLAAADLVAR